MPALVFSQESVSQQLWGNAVFGIPKDKHLYLEIDVEPKKQISGMDYWGNLDITPLIEYYPNSWIDLTGEITAGYTNQTSAVNTMEVTPRLGIRAHFFTNVWQYFKTSERVPLSRLTLATLLRLELRNFWYSNDQASEHETRLRLRLESKIAINHEKLAYDNTYYLFCDAEYYMPLSEKISERFASKFRFRIGPGYRLTYANRFEILLIYDFARDTLNEKADRDALAIDFRFKFYF
jgi:hypothetical protein